MITAAIALPHLYYISLARFNKYDDQICTELIFLRAGTQEPNKSVFVSTLLI